MTVKLNSHVVLATYNNSQPTTFQTGGSFKVEVPQPTVMLAKSVSYDFRVVEYVDANDKIMKVGLQYRMWEHDNYGAGNVVQDWIDVERVKVVHDGKS